MTSGNRRPAAAMPEAVRVESTAGTPRPEASSSSGARENTSPALEPWNQIGPGPWVDGANPTRWRVPPRTLGCRPSMGKSGSRAAAWAPLYRARAK